MSTPHDSSADARNRDGEQGHEVRAADAAAAPLRSTQAPPPTVVMVVCGSEGAGELVSFLGEAATEEHLAFVVLGALDAPQSTELHNLLATPTGMPVKVVRATESVDTSTIYLATPGTLLEYRDGRLHAVDPPSREVAACPADYFLRSIADAMRERAIVVVLSGTGSDGALGIRAVEAAGGITLAINPEFAVCDELPRNAIRTGIVDYVVQVEAMRSIIARYVRHPYVRGADAASVAVETPEARAASGVREVIGVLRSRAGYNFESYKKGTLARRIERRMGLGQFHSYGEYADHLQANPTELNELFNDLLICVTEFFRDAGAWDELRRLVVNPIVAARNDDEAIRVWVAGCATGEEAYTVAMMFIDELREQRKRCPLQVFASDINDGALEVARAGLYPKNVTATVPEHYLRRYFAEIPGAHQYAMRAVVRDAVTFAHQNLIADPPFSNLDLVLCRNLLIYLEPEMQQRAISLFHFALRPSGFLFLGTAETIGRQSDLFDSVSNRWRIYTRGDASRRDPMQFPAAPSVARRQRHAGARSRALSDEPKLARIAQQLVLEQFAPAAVLIDQHYDIVHFSGPTTDYLVQPSGAPTNDLLVMAREGLRVKLRRLVQHALREGLPVRSSDIRVKRGAAFHNVSVTVAPVKVEHRRNPLLLVVFEEASTGRVEASVEPVSSSESESIVRQLENELIMAREDVRVHVEEVEASNEDLKVANEEVMSINEELQAANEELETSKEELQSLNEELNTVNHQLHEKLEELESTSNDLGNLLTSTEIATIFLDRSLRIKRFTPAVRRLVNIIASDIGRPIADFSRNFSDDALIDDARTVLDRLVPCEHEVHTSDGRWYLRRILPYRTESDHIDGVVITFIDTTDVRLAGARLEESETKYRLLIESAIDFAIFMLDIEGRFVTWNSGAERILGYGEKEIIGRSASIIFVPEDRATGEDVRELETARTEGRAADERWHLRKDGTRFWGSGVVTPLFDDAGNLRGYSKVMRDQTDRRRMESELKQLNETLEQMVAERTAALRALSTELLIAEERERRELAADLHDSIGQTLALASMKLKEASRTGGVSLDEVRDLIDNANEAVRSVTMQISPPILYQIGLLPALEWLAEEMERRYGLSVVVDARKIPTSMDDRIRFVLFRSVRELLINVTKHAEVRDARVRIGSSGGFVAIEVDDNGKGFEVTGETIARRAHGFGLFSIRERLTYIGGEASIRSTPGIGTTVVLRAPTHIQDDAS